MDYLLTRLRCGCPFTSGIVGDGEQHIPMGTSDIPDLDYVANGAPAPTFAVLGTPVETWSAIHTDSTARRTGPSGARYPL